MKSHFAYKQECWCLWGREFVLHAPNLFTGTIMDLTRDRILKPGKYASVPHCVLESSTLKPSHKLVYQILLDHLGENEMVWPGLATIAKRTALSIRCVRRSQLRPWLTEVALIRQVRDHRRCVQQTLHIYDPEVC